MSEVVALLLDDAMPSQRLGALLLAARKRSGMKRKAAAAAADTTPAKLRKYEHGDAPVPADVCARLAECYGDDLTAHVPLRVPLHLAGGNIAVGDIEQPVGPAVDDVISGYVDIVRRLRSTGPGDPLSLRSVDIFALAGALGRDRATIEERIAEVLGCTPTEARRLHGELLRRKVILPVAGLAAGMAAFAGVAYAAHSPASAGTNIQVQSISATGSSTTTPPTTATKLKPATPPTTTAPVITPPTTARPAKSHVQHVTQPTTEPAPRTDATVPVHQRTADVPVTVANPQPDPNDPPVSVLPGETPISVIGTPDSTSDTTP